MEMREDRVKFYNDALKEYKDDYAKQVGWSSEKSVDYRFNLVKNLMGDVSSKTILDYGCGTGNLYGLVLSRENNHHRYIGVDYNQNMIDFIWNKWGLPDLNKETYGLKMYRSVVLRDPDLKFVESTGYKFDIITSIGVFQEFNNFIEVRDKIMQLYNLLQEGGKFIFTTLSNRTLPPEDVDHTMYRLSVMDIVNILEYNHLKYEINMKDLGDQIIVVIYK